MEQEFKQYKRKGLSEMRPYVKGEDMSKVSIQFLDDPKTDMGMVARNPMNHEDQWYVARKYFEDNLEEATENVNNKILNLVKGYENESHRELVLKINELMKL